MHAKINCVCEVLQVASYCHTFLKELSHQTRTTRLIEYAFAGPKQHHVHLESGRNLYRNCQTSGV
jgi:hypothetical protein